MDVMEALTQARDAMTVRRVYGEPYSQDGVTVIPVARVSGGAGGGGGTQEGEHPSSGSGGGFGVGAVPTGVFVLRGDEVSWQPAIDLNRVILGGQVVAVVALLTLRTVVRVRARTHRHHAHHAAGPGLSRSTRTG